MQKEFNWQDWVDIYSPDTATISEILDKFKTVYLAKNSVTCWQNYLLSAYKWLPQDQQLTIKAIAPALTRHAKDSRSRQVAFNAISVLLKYTELEIDIEQYRSTYTRASLNPRNIPSDEAIAEWYDKITNPSWRWAYGVFATYGIRNHEIFHIELELPNIRVIEGKTNQFAIATNDTVEILRVASRLVELIYREGQEFKKAGVIMTGLCPEVHVQGNLFALPMDTERSSKLMKVIDDVNTIFGRHTLKFSAAGITQAWLTKSEKRSPRYTTCWNELLAEMSYLL